MGIAGLIVGTFIGDFFGKEIVCSGIGVRSGVSMTDGARGITH